MTQMTETSLLKVTSDAVKKKFFSSVGAEFEGETLPTNGESQASLV